MAVHFWSGTCTTIRTVSLNSEAICTRSAKYVLLSTYGTSHHSSVLVSSSMDSPITCYDAIFYSLRFSGSRFMWDQRRNNALTVILLPAVCRWFSLQATFCLSRGRTIMGKWQAAAWVVIDNDSLLIEWITQPVTKSLYGPPFFPAPICRTSNYIWRKTMTNRRDSACLHSAQPRVNKSASDRESCDLYLCG